jgi:hypothetical protein
MAESVQIRGPESVGAEGVEAPEEKKVPVEHWSGYPGEAEAESYPVVEVRGRYRLLFTLMFLSFLIVAIVFMTRENWQHRPAEPTSPVQIR